MPTLPKFLEHALNFEVSITQSHSTFSQSMALPNDKPQRDQLVSELQKLVEGKSQSIWGNDKSLKDVNRDLGEQYAALLLSEARAKKAHVERLPEPPPPPEPPPTSTDYDERPLKL